MTRRILAASVLLVVGAPFAASQALAEPVTTGKKLCLVFPAEGPRAPIVDGFCIGTHAAPELPAR